MRCRNVGNSFNLFGVEDAQVGLPLMVEEQDLDTGLKNLPDTIMHTDIDLPENPIVSAKPLNDSLLIKDLTIDHLPNQDDDRMDDGLVVMDDSKGTTTTDKKTGTVIDPPEEEYEIGKPITPELLVGKPPAHCQMTFAETRNGFNYPRKSSWTGWSVRLWWCRARRNDAE